MLHEHYVHAPALRDPELEQERHSTWLESLFDLAFAGAIGNFAVTLGKNYDFHALAHLLILYIPVMWCWVGQTFYSSRFDVNDIWQTLFAIMQMGCVGGMAIFGAKPLSEGSIFFALSYACCRAILVIQFWRTAKHVPEARAYCMGMGNGFLVALSLWVVSIFIPPPFRYAVWGIAIALDLLTPQLLNKHNLVLKVHLSHIPERYGLITLIIISDIFVSQINALASQKLSFSTMFLGTLTFLVAIAAYWDYYEAVGGADPREAKDKNSLRAFRVWMYLHFPYGAGLVILSGLSRFAIDHGDTHQLSIEQSIVFLIGALLTIITPILLWYTLPHHFGRKDHFKLIYKYLYLSIPVFLLMYIAYRWGTLAGLSGLCFIYAIRFVQQAKDTAVFAYFHKVGQTSPLGKYFGAND